MTKKDQKQPEKLEPQPVKDIEDKSKIIADYENTLKRLQADFENYVKRVDKEKQDATKYAVAKILTKVVNIVDDLDRSMQVLEKTQDKEIKTGIQMIHKQFHKILQEEGIKPFDSKGKKLDPYQHEVIEIVAHDSPEGTVIEELEKGYHLHDKILRTAKVRVSKGKSQEKK
ncbi:MAG: nucleotide exchange factor GrpE [bacterium]|nr:nucleotide exchange factor GrpE [bacterium]